MRHAIYESYGEKTLFFYDDLFEPKISLKAASFPLFFTTFSFLQLPNHTQIDSHSFSLSIHSLTRALFHAFRSACFKNFTRTFDHMLTAALLLASKALAQDQGDGWVNGTFIRSKIVERMTVERERSRCLGLPKIPRRPPISLGFLCPSRVHLLHSFLPFPSLPRSSFLPSRPINVLRRARRRGFD